VRGGVIFGVAGGFWVGLAFGVGGERASGLTAGVLIGIIAGVSWGIAGAIAASQTVGLFISCTALRIRGIAPLHLLAFLEDARRRQVLRQAGSVYQFRHAEPQDYLSGLSGQPISESVTDSIVVDPNG
jgi:hypothetical protein